MENNILLIVFTILLYVLFCWIFSTNINKIYREKDISKHNYFWWCFFTGPIGMLLKCILDSINPMDWEKYKKEELKRDHSHDLY